MAHLSCSVEWSGAILICCTGGGEAATGGYKRKERGGYKREADSGRLPACVRDYGGHWR